MKFLQSPLLASVLGGLIYLATTFWQLRQVSVKPPVERIPIAKAGPKKIAAATGSKLTWDPQNPEVDQLVKELRSEKESLAKRQETLNELAARLQSERQEIDRVAQSVQRMQSDFERSVTKVKEDETANLKRLSKMYTTMTPDGAAKIFAEMDEESVGKILLQMKETDAALILESLSRQGGSSAKRAADLSERLRVAARGNSPKAK